MSAAVFLSGERAAAAGRNENCKEKNRCKREFTRQIDTRLNVWLLNVMRDLCCASAGVPVREARTVRRRYLAVVLGVPEPASGRVNAPVGRDPRDRLKMAVVRGVGGGRPAASNYTVRATLAGGNAALVEWRLAGGGCRESGGNGGAEDCRPDRRCSRTQSSATLSYSTDSDPFV